MAFMSKEKLGSKVVRNILFSPEQQAYAKEMLNSPQTKALENRTRLATKLATTSFRELITNTFKNLVHVFSK